MNYFLMIQAPANYKYDYAVKDDYYNDYGKTESREGDLTKGSYWVALPDGRRMVVTYYVDGYSGFVADVKYEGEIKPYDYKPAPYAAQSKEDYHHAEPKMDYHHPEPKMDYHHSEPKMDYHHHEPKMDYHHPEPKMDYHHPQHVADVHHYPEHKVDHHVYDHKPEVHTIHH